MQASKPADIAIPWILDVGRVLAANLVDHGYSVAAYDAFPEVLENARGVPGSSLGLLDSLAGLMVPLKKSARILMMRKAGCRCGWTLRQNLSQGH